MEPTLFNGICYIIGVSLVVFGIPTIITFALTEFILNKKGK